MDLSNPKDIQGLLKRRSDRFIFLYGKQLSFTCKAAVALLWISITIQVGPVNILQILQKFIHISRTFIAYKDCFAASFYDFIIQYNNTNTFISKFIIVKVTHGENLRGGHKHFKDKKSKSNKRTNKVIRKINSGRPVNPRACRCRGLFLSKPKLPICQLVWYPRELISRA